ncbi:molybdopterin-dependent oxidoreductase [Brevibacillus parabrevis]|nr:molybdopterin-dependent oxidoreductase [Brevibacillus parabrevis]MED1723934.1 molybdopterin-dependent oxidoreductase [Brevibacillus parabrevis]
MNLVVQDIFFSETAHFADVVLPASPSLEKDGTFVNTERRIQRLYKVFEPLGLMGMGRAMMEPNVTLALGSMINFLRGMGEGIRQAEVSLAKGEALVSYDEKAASLIDFQQAIRDLGYEVALK